MTINPSLFKNLKYIRIIFLFLTTLSIKYSSINIECFLTKIFSNFIIYKL